MNGVIVTVALILLGLVEVNCYCEKEKFGIGRRCSFKVRCYHTIEDLDLPPACHNFTRRDFYAYPFIDLYLSEDTVIKDIRNIYFLSNAKALRLNSPKPSEALGLLTYMPNLQHLYLQNSNIDEILDVHPLLYNTKLRSIDFSHNNLSYLDDLFIFEDTPNVERLILSHNSIGHLPGETFEALTQLIELDLSFNYLTDLSEEPFSNLTNLQILRLNNNNLENITGGIENLHNLKELYLRQNQIHFINGGILNIIYNLEKFDISKNNVLELATDIFFRKWTGSNGMSIYEIILAENNIKSVPNTTLEIRATRDSKIDDAKMITKLNISKNAISEVGYNAFHGIHRLTSLDLSSNNLTNFYVNSDDLKFLKFLYLKDNSIKSLDYKELSPMTQLQFIDISNNEVANLGRRAFTDNRKLRHVSLAHNKIKVIKGDLELFRIDGGLLDLSHNDLDRIDIPFNATFRITTLVLRSNKIRDAAFVNLIYHTSLQTLIMSDNFLTNLKTLRLPESLIHLDISNNQISHIAASTFQRLGNLRVLSLSNNNLRRFEYGVFKGLGKLQKLFLTANNLTHVNSDVFSDLKSLEFLSLKDNGLKDLDSYAWLEHKTKIHVNVDGNDNLSCSWLSNAIKEYNNGISKMRPTVDFELNDTNGPNVEGIPCHNDNDRTIYSVYSNTKLIFMNQKILEAIKHQTDTIQKLFTRVKKN